MAPSQQQLLALTHQERQARQGLLALDLCHSLQPRLLKASGCHLGSSETQ